MDEQRIKELLADEEFVKELVALETPEEVQAMLEEYDIEVTTEEIQQIHDFLVEHEGEELSEEDLENVAGGFGLIILALIIVGAIATGTLAGTVGLGRRW